MSTAPGPGDLIRSYRDRLAMANRQLRESLGEDPLAGHLLAWDAERLADLAGSSGSPPSEVGRLLRDAALYAERAVAHGSHPSALQRTHYMALAVIAARRPLAQAVGGPLLADVGPWGIDACLAALVLWEPARAAELTAAAEDADRTAVVAARAVAARDEAALGVALRVRCDEHPHPEDPHRNPLYARAGGGALDLVATALAVLGQSAGLEVRTACPWVPLEAARHAA